MKLLTISPSSIGYRWEIEVLAVNSIGHGWPAEDMIWLSYGGSDEEQSEDARLATALGIEHHHFPDDRPAKKYPTSIRPWLWSRFLREHPARQRGSYFYCDSDVIFSRLPDLTALEQAVTPEKWLGSQTCSYTSPSRLRNASNERVVAFLAELTGATATDLARYEHTSPGAQWVLRDPKPDLFDAVYERCETAFEVLVEFQALAAERGVQPAPTVNPWFADMWVFLWSLPSFGILPATHEELEFSLAYEPVERFLQVPIHHNSGLLQAQLDALGLFDKHKFRTSTPFGTPLTTSPYRCSARYVEAILKAEHFYRKRQGHL